MIGLNDRPLRSSTVVGRLAEDGAVLVLPERGEVKTLNQVGARIWSLSDGSRSVVEIVEILCSEFSVDAETAAADALDFLNELGRHGIVELAGSER